LGKYKGRLIMLLDMNKLLEFSAQKAPAETKPAGAKPEARSAAAR
jgi:uncharacterized protein (DUF3820 family)